MRRLRRLLRGRKWLIVVAALLVLPALYIARPAISFARGGAAALFDVSRGQYKTLGYGLPVRSRALYAEILKANYDIEFVAVAGCVVSTPLISYVNGYNSVSEDAAKRKFGRDVFEKSRIEADRVWKQRSVQDETDRSWKKELDPD